MANGIDRERFVGEMVREFPEREVYEIHNLCRFLMRCAAGLCRWAEYSHSIGRPLNADEKKRIERLEQRVEKTAEEWGMRAMLDDNPLAVPILLKVPSGKTNDFAGEGLVVPF